MGAMDAAWQFSKTFRVHQTGSLCNYIQVPDVHSHVVKHKHKPYVEAASGANHGVDSL